MANKLTLSTSIIQGQRKIKSYMPLIYVPKINLENIILNLKRLG